MHRHLFHFILLLLLSLLSHSCSSPHTHAIQEAEGIMDQYPDSALSILEDIPCEELRGSQARALHALLLTQARSKNYITETNDSLISTAVSYFESTDDSHHLMLALHYFGELNFNRKAYARSLTALFKAYDLAVRLDDKFWIAMSARMIADIYHENYHTAEEIEFSEIELENFRLAHRQPYINYAILDLAKTYAAAEKNEEAIDLSKQLIDSATKYNDTILYIEAIRSIGVTHINSGDYSKAIPYLSDVCNSPYANRYDSIYYGIANLRVGNVATASKLSKNFDPSDNQINAWLRYIVCVEMDSMHQAMKVLQQMNNFTDSILRSVMSQSLGTSMREFYISERNLNEARLKSTRAIAISIIIITVLLLTIAAIYLIRYRKRKLEIINNNVEIARNLSELLAKDAKSQATIQSLLAERFTVIDNLCRTLYEAPSGVAKKRISEEITSLIDQYSSDSKKLSELESLVNRHHNNILIKLRNEFPDLKDPDLRLFMFSVLGFSNSAIAIFLGEAKITAIYDRRKRLKAKFRNSASPNKEIYLKAIS
ncbi:hypothetical protein [Duncaniella sp.]|uniref:tetratricopeptide repeat protein n=1 Tax=Duncaniella sp. TaxID=2518496 RepID=UPI0023D6750C|nr:hypothetical protein [Duncaniella sp.]MDE5905735.1 hypothetical protein [Duncaniella sp.]